MSITPQPLRCLIVEDSEDDARLLLRQLRKDFGDVISERVDTADAMRVALARQPWDIVLSDWTMPHFSGLAALEVLKASDLDLPFIIVTGSIGEAAAVAAMKSGAHDFLFKGALAALAPAMSREIAAAVERRLHRESELELRQSEERFRRAVVHSPFPIMIHAEDGAVLQVSETWCEITGYHREEIATIGDWTERAYGARKQSVQSDIDKLYGLDRRNYDGDYTIRTKSGHMRIWEFSSAPLGRLPDGRRAVISIALDVTERRHGESELRDREAELRVRNDALERFNDAAVGRELRMIELKREINALCVRHGEPPRYHVADLSATRGDHV